MDYFFNALGRQAGAELIEKYDIRSQADLAVSGLTYATVAEYVNDRVLENLDAVLLVPEDIERTKE